MKKFKDGLPKYYNVTLNFYIVVLFILLIIKLMGFDYFGIKISIIEIENINIMLDSLNLRYVIQFANLFIQLYFIIYILLKNKPKIIEVFLITLLNSIISFLLINYNLLSLYSIANIVILATFFIIKKCSIKNIVYFFTINIILQFISAFIKIGNIIEYGFIETLLMGIDYTIMLIIWKNIVMIGGENLCGIYQLRGLFGVLLMELKSLPTKFLKYLKSFIVYFKNQTKNEKMSLTLYLIISLIYNLFSVFLVLFVAFLNDTVIECLFILIAFMSTKTAFGKAFHFNSAKLCFIVSNLSYYALNRITTPIGISILVPIILGISLSYATSFLVKEKISTKLYRGMSEELFEELILKVIDKNSTYYNVCKDFYINKYSELKLANKYHYTINGIKKIKTKIRDKLKEL